MHAFMQADVCMYLIGKTVKTGRGKSRVRERKRVYYKTVIKKNSCESEFIIKQSSRKTPVSQVGSPAAGDKLKVNGGGMK